MRKWIKPYSRKGKGVSVSCGPRAAGRGLRAAGARIYPVSFQRRWFLPDTESFLLFPWPSLRVVVYDVVRGEKHRSESPSVPLCVSYTANPRYRLYLCKIYRPLSATTAVISPNAKAGYLGREGKRTSFSARRSTSRHASALTASSSSARRRRTAANLSRHDAAVAATAPPCPPLLPFLPGVFLAVFFASEPLLLSPVLSRVAPVQATDEEIKGRVAVVAAPALRCFTAYALLLLSPARAYLLYDARAARAR